jgi:hypothetical protein
MLLAQAAAAGEVESRLGPMELTLGTRAWFSTDRSDLKKNASSLSEQRDGFASRPTPACSTHGAP